MWELVVTADTNDADYVTETTEISQEDLDHFLTLAQDVVLKTRYTEQAGIQFHNWPSSEYADKSPQDVYDWPEEEFDFFSEFLPCGEYGIHTIKSIVYYPVPTKTVVL